MFIKDWKKELFTIPNFLSLFRLLLIPVYILIYLNAKHRQEYTMAATILALSCLTDMIDGQIARRFNMITNIGKILDPLADKMTQLALTICLSIRYPALQGVLLLLVVKELFQIIAAAIMLRRGKFLNGSLVAGKVCTTVLFLSLILPVLQPELNITTVNAIAIIDIAFLSYAFITYILAFFGRNAKIQDIEA